jgi:hypothetical protein
MALPTGSAFSGLGLPGAGTSPLLRDNAVVLIFPGTKPNRGGGVQRYDTSTGGRAH